MPRMRELRSHTPSRSPFRGDLLCAASDPTRCAASPTRMRADVGARPTIKIIERLAGFRLGFLRVTRAAERSADPPRAPTRAHANVIRRLRDEPDLRSSRRLRIVTRRTGFRCAKGRALQIGARGCARVLTKIAEGPRSP